MEIWSVSDLGAASSSIKCSDAREDMTLLAGIPMLDQCEIEGGSYREIDGFLVESDISNQENYLRVKELVERLANADPDSVVVYLDSYADVDESDEICEVLVDLNLWTHEVGTHHGTHYEVRYPGGPRATDSDSRVVTTQAVERVVVLSDGPTNLRYVTPRGALFP